MSCNAPLPTPPKVLAAHIWAVAWMWAAVSFFFSFLFFFGGGGGGGGGIAGHPKKWLWRRQVVCVIWFEYKAPTLSKVLLSNSFPYPVLNFQLPLFEVGINHYFLTLNNSTEKNFSPLSIVKKLQTAACRNQKISTSQKSFYYPCHLKSRVPSLGCTQASTLYMHNRTSVYFIKAKNTFFFMFFCEWLQYLMPNCKNCGFREVFGIRVFIECFAVTLLWWYHFCE